MGRGKKTPAALERGLNKVFKNKIVRFILSFLARLPARYLFKSKKLLCVGIFLAAGGVLGGSGDDCAMFGAGEKQDRGAGAGAIGADLE